MERMCICVRSFSLFTPFVHVSVSCWPTWSEACVCAFVLPQGHTVRAERPRRLANHASGRIPGEQNCASTRVGGGGAEGVRGGDLKKHCACVVLFVFGAAK